MAAIQATGLRREFRKFVAVEGLDLTIAAGTSFGMLGPNGAGKSTLIRMLTTLIVPTSGTASVAGHDIVKNPSDVRRSIGVIPQAMTSDPDLTAEENLVFYGRLFGMSAQQCRKQADELLEQVDLVSWRHKLVGTFSGGMRRRLEIARSLLHQPKVLFLDEPTTGLDPASRIAMWEMITALKARTSLTIFLTTHYMEEADQLCDQIGIFDHGNLIALDTPGGLKARATKSRIVRTGWESAPSAWGEVLRSLPGAVNVTQRRDSCEIDSTDAMITVSGLLSAAREHTVVITSLIVSGSTLEDVFVELTGRALRDSASSRSSKLDVGHLYDKR